MAAFGRGNLSWDIFPEVLFFGIIAAVLVLTFIYSDPRRTLCVAAIKYGLLFTTAAVNLTLCYWATHIKQTRPFLTPLFFFIPTLLATAPTVFFMWYGVVLSVDLLDADVHISRPGHR
jgi:hypothetical protein